MRSARPPRALRVPLACTALAILVALVGASTARATVSAVAGAPDRNALLAQVVTELQARDSASDARYFNAGIWMGRSNDCWPCRVGPAVGAAASVPEHPELLPAVVATMNRGIADQRLSDGSFGDPINTTSVRERARDVVSAGRRPPRCGDGRPLVVGGRSCRGPSDRNGPSRVLRERQHQPLDHHDDVARGPDHRRSEVRTGVRDVPGRSRCRRRRRSGRVSGFMARVPVPGTSPSRAGGRRDSTRFTASCRWTSRRRCTCWRAIRGY